MIETNTFLGSAEEAVWAFLPGFLFPFCPNHLPVISNGGTTYIAAASEGQAIGPSPKVQGKVKTALGYANSLMTESGFPFALIISTLFYHLIKKSQSLMWSIFQDIGSTLTMLSIWRMRLISCRPASV
jgi:hypothetical protein